MNVGQRQAAADLRLSQAAIVYVYHYSVRKLIII